MNNTATKAATRTDEDIKPLRICGLLGVLSLASYLAAMVLSPAAYPGYDWMSSAVSDLSAVGAPSRELWMRLSCLYDPCGIVCATAACVYVAYRRPADKTLRAGIYLFTAMEWLSTVGYRLFPLDDPGKTLAGFTEFMHVYVVTTAVVLLSIASLVCIIVSGARGKGPKSLARWAGLALAMMFCGAAGSGIVPPQYFGIAERVSLVAAVGFNAVLGLYLWRGLLR